MPTNPYMKIIFGAGLFQIVPLILDKVVEGWNWTVADFVVCFVFLSIAGSIYHFAMTQVQTRSHKILAGILVILFFVWLWAELAVGIFTQWGS